MTPSEKAKELVDKFFFIGFGGGEDKEFAMICVDEIILALSTCDNWGDVYKFYNEVKEELNKL